MVIIFLFVIGLCVGSFLNVLIDRIPKKESIIVGRSHCDFCEHMLSGFDLVPLFSFLFLKGKCRYCHKKLSIQYPLVELIIGLFFVVTFLVQNPTTNNAYIFYSIYISLLCIGFALSVMDFKYHILSDTLLIAFGAVTFLQQLIFYPHTVLINFFIGIVTCLPFLVIFLLTKGKGMGFGDVKLSFVLGFFLGFPKIGIAIYIAFLTGGVAGIILVLGRKKKMKSAIAFGPFLFFGAFVAQTLGDTIWNVAKIFLGL